MAKIIDISVPLQSDMPIWPGSQDLCLKSLMSIENGDQTNVSRLDLDVHAGTHVDAPLHYIMGGASVEQMSLDILLGPAFILYLPQVDIITADTLSASSIPEGTERLLLRTKNSEFWNTPPAEFRTDYAALTEDAAKWIVEHGIRLIGIDYLSVQCYNDNSETHEILLGANVIIIEGLNLTDIVPGHYELICLPLRLVGSEGAPARVVLRQLQ